MGLDSSVIARINELAHKAKTQGLTPEELAERDRLRKEYIAAFRRSLVNELESLTLVDEQGNRRKLHPKAQPGGDDGASEAEQ